RAGDAATAMGVLWLANAINILLGPCLIFGLGPFPRLGVTGAAVATTIGRGTGVLYQLYRLTRGDARVAVRRIHLALRPAVMATLLRLSGSGTFQVLVGTASYIGLVRIMSTFGSAALAGYTIAIRIVIFALLPSWGLSNAAATMVGQSLGAAQPARAERAVWIAGGYNMVVLGLVGTVFVVLAGPIVSLFTHDPTAAPTGALALRTISYGFLFYALGMVLTQSFNGAGDTWTPTWINLGCFWLWEIPDLVKRVPPDAPVIQVGDFGIWPHKLKEWVDPGRPIMFLDGNHDAPIHLVTGEWKNAQYLPRGTVLELGDSVVLTCGGATS